MRFPVAAVTAMALSILTPQMAVAAAAADTPVKAPLKPCTLKSPLTGAYFDLNKIAIHAPPPKDGSSESGNGDSKPKPVIGGEVRSESWRARGYDYGANFTMNICAPVVEELGDVVGVQEGLRKNVSAFYTKDDKVYSIGQVNNEPIWRGKRMVLNYTDGSPCASTINEDAATDGTTTTTTPPSDGRRKSTIISFLCDRDMVAPPATVSFVGTLDECSYFFEVRSSAACGGVAAPAEGGLSPAGVFGVIALIAVAVYLLGGCAYQRTVMHQRGWRQLPNYTLWAGLATLVRDMATSTLSCLTTVLHLERCFPQLLERGLRSGSGRAASSTRGGYGSRARGRGRYGRLGSNDSVSPWSERVDMDEENRIIDQLDEEWED
ncbi:Cation-independent mannose-6-phosphate receptor [Ascosphaera acerosa]|nr:Cation-independent mannose-6-phosphate receptor [Ascosphaera acerosa]